MESMEYNELFSRTELLIGPAAMQQIASKKVILFGVGGVGSWCAEGLIRQRDHAPDTGRLRPGGSS